MCRRVHLKRPSQDTQSYHGHHSRRGRSLVVSYVIYRVIFIVWSAFISRVPFHSSAHITPNPKRIECEARKGNNATSVSDYAFTDAMQQQSPLGP